MTHPPSYTAFAAERLVHRGPLVDVLAAIKLKGADDPASQLLIFENETGRQVDFDLRGSLDDVLKRLKTREAPKGPGRPRLGVESREVTLLPRHWAWLERQPSGASAALRRLVDGASRRADPVEASRRRTDAVYRVMAVLAGDRVGFEEAARALFAGDEGRLHSLMAKWPKDIRGHLFWLTAPPSGEPP